jgi:hypothetical protein
MNLPPPPPLTGTNTVALKPWQDYAGNQKKEAGVHQMDNNYYYTASQGGRNEYKEYDQTYMVFVTEPNDKQNLCRRNMEVNAIMSAVPK